MTADEYLWGILNREAVDTGQTSPVRGVQATLMPTLRAWAGNQLVSVEPSGSFAKGTANKSGTDIDLFISLAEDTTNTLKEIYESLFSAVQSAGYSPKRQNVSINIRVGSYDVDLVPGKRQDRYSDDHSLYRRKADTWIKTNVKTHINTVIAGRRAPESRILKLWRNQKSFDFPSFYLELVAIEALRQNATTSLATNVQRVFAYLRDTFPNARFVDPANTNNIISDDLTVAEKGKVRSAAEAAISAPYWSGVVT